MSPYEIKKFVITKMNRDEIIEMINKSLKRLGWVSAFLHITSSTVILLMLYTYIVVISSTAGAENLKLPLHLLILMIVMPSLHLIAFSVALDENIINIKNEKACLEAVNSINEGEIDIVYDVLGKAHITIIQEDKTPLSECIEKITEEITEEIKKE